MEYNSQGEDMGNDTMPPAKDPSNSSTMPQDESGMEICVPTASLAMPGEDEKMNSPEVGDPVQLQAEGKVSRIEGDNAYVSIKSVNGKPVTAEGAKTTNTPEMDENGDNEFAQLQSEAKEQPQY